MPAITTHPTSLPIPLICSLASIKVRTRRFSFTSFSVRGGPTLNRGRINCDSHSGNRKRIRQLHLPRRSAFRLEKFQGLPTK